MAFPIRLTIDRAFTSSSAPVSQALPVIITWLAGSVMEQLKIIGPLTDPTAYGGSARR
jgi:hypothetical protein